MEKLKINDHHLAVMVCLIILVIAGSFFTYTMYFAPENLRHDQQQDPGSLCDPMAAAPRAPIPVDTSIPIQDPMPGIRYSLNVSDSDKTIVLGKGDVFEINLEFAPGLAMRWTVPVSGCGIELVNDGNYYTGGDFWNNIGYYRARYRAVSPGTSALKGKLVLTPTEDPTGAPRFNLTVIVK